jgi:hypothetical protein
MKRNLILTGVAAFLLSSVTACTFAADSHTNFYGSASAPAAASRTVVVGPDTTHVNVTKGETVKFLSGDKTFAWHFDEVSTLSEVDLNDIAPAGTLDHNVKVYLRRDPTTDGG